MDTESTPARQNTERLFARGFTILGGVFWIVAAFAGPYMYLGKSVAGAFGYAIYPLIFTIAVFAIGWFSERLVSMLLAVGAIGTIAWGVIMGWETTVWAIMLIFFIAPTVVAAILYFLAGSKAEGPRTTQSQDQVLS
jgi:hypothetical protein